MRSLVAKRVAAVVAALGFAAVGVALTPGVASAAPAGGGVQLCVASDADYSAVLQWPSRGGFETYVINPGNCSSWYSENGGETIVVLGDYNGSSFNLGNFGADGGSQTVYAQGRVGSGTESFWVAG